MQYRKVDTPINVTVRSSEGKIANNPRKLEILFDPHALTESIFFFLGA